MSDAQHGSRPAYGEYATPEEQRARIAQPDATFSLDAGVAPAVVAQERGARGTTPDSVEAKPQRTADRVITIALLAYGLFSVALTAISLVDFPTVASTSMEIIGIPGEFTNVAQGRLFGTIAAVALVVGWVVTAWVSWRRLRTGRITWWVPLVGAAATYLVVWALMIPPIVGDPAFIDYVTSTAS